MLTAAEVRQRYLDFFKSRGHVEIPGARLVPQNDPTTLFTSSGMQPLIPYLTGEKHPQGNRLVDIQNCFRAQDIDEIGDNRHTTFFRMMGNWSLGDYFKTEQLGWFFAFLTDTQTGLGLDCNKLHFTVFDGYKDFTQDEESYQIWEKILQEKTTIQNAASHIHYYGADKNWWSRAGNPDQMPPGEIGGPTSEVFYDYGDLTVHERSPWKDKPCHVNCDCGRYVEIGNSVFMTYKKNEDGSFSPLPKKNVDFGGGLERLLAAAQDQPDIFQTSLLQPIIQAIELAQNSTYAQHQQAMRIIADHLIAAAFILADGVVPANKEQGYVLRRLIRRAVDQFNQPVEKLSGIVQTIVEEYGKTDKHLIEKYELIKNSLLEEVQKYARTKTEAKKFIEKKYSNTKDNHSEHTVHHDGNIVEISADDAFVLYTTHGLSPTQIKSLGYTFADQAFAEKMEAHQSLSRAGAEKKFKGGLADHSEKTVMGHTATHLLHQALRDVLGDSVHQSGSNITSERIRFDFNFDRKLTDEELLQVEKVVDEKIKENLPVHFEIMPIDEAKKLGAIGLFMDTYGDKVKIYFIGPSDSHAGSRPYSTEFCGGPHVDFTGQLKSFKIIKQENLGANLKRLYAVTGE